MQEEPPSLTVAFSTLGARVRDLDGNKWPYARGLDYLLLVQGADSGVAQTLATLEQRPDVAVHRLTTTGLSRSRNAALDHATGDIILIADDDVIHLPGAFDGIREFFAANPKASLLVGQSFAPDGRPRKRFSSKPHSLRVWNAAGVSSHELSFRRKAVLAAGVRFDDRFGAGSDTAHYLGEEYIFIADCLQAGLHGTYAPLPLTVHPKESSGFIWSGAAAAKARGAIFTRVFHRWALPMRMVFAMKNINRFSGLGDLWSFLRA